MEDWGGTLQSIISDNTSLEFTEKINNKLFFCQNIIFEADVFKH